ncbi:MAG: glucose-1-phosphate cytidylyltransferase [Oscillospiraceae bacterium]|jgi:glucose-1-phosphate cytidylyltransferase|nr:glucose-1-phosphate cytidylyltransferase [Oscillospiraceae bacterium]
MKVVILAGGKGTRIAEESAYRPKPMVEIGGRPILWHIMNWYASFGYTEFIICCGYKGQMIKQYFLDYYMKNSSIHINLKTGRMERLSGSVEPWKVTLVNTGLETLTAGRLLQVQKYMDGDTFMLTYGDGVGDIDIPELLNFHRKSGKIATISVTKPEGRFGAVKLDESSGLVSGFREKARLDQSWANIGFAVFSSDVFQYLGDGSSMLEKEPYEKLASDRQMAAYLHHGFWSPMDTIRDKKYLEQMLKSGNAPWIPAANYF